MSKQRSCHQPRCSVNFMLLQVVDLLIFKGREDLETYLMMHKQRHHLVCLMFSMLHTPIWANTSVTTVPTSIQNDLCADYRVCGALPVSQEQCDEAIWSHGLPRWLFLDAVPANPQQVDCLHTGVGATLGAWHLLWHHKQCWLVFSQPYWVD